MEGQKANVGKGGKVYQVGMHLAASHGNSDSHSEFVLTPVASILVVGRNQRRLGMIPSFSRFTRCLLPPPINTILETASVF